MSNPPETPARIIPEIEAQVISQKLEYWHSGIGVFVIEAGNIIQDLQEKLKNPTRKNLHSIRADLASLLEAQRMIQGVNASCRAGLHDLKERFSKTFTILDI